MNEFCPHRLPSEENKTPLCQVRLNEGDCVPTCVNTNFSQADCLIPQIANREISIGEGEEWLREITREKT